MLSVLILIAFPRQQKVQGLTDALNGTTRESLTGVRVVRAYNAEAYQTEKFKEENSNLIRLNLFVYRLMSLMNPVMTMVSSGLTLEIYWNCSLGSRKGRWSRNPQGITCKQRSLQRNRLFTIIKGGVGT